MLALSLLPGLVQAKSKKPVRATHGKASKHVSHKRVTRKSHGQQAIDTERVREIQAALIREHYLDGEPDGVWNSHTKAAMQKYQSDQGWQSKVVPDSRALIKLGLGPDHAGLLNPQTAAIEQPVPGGGSSSGNR